jgi:hypothetical protein
VCTSFVVVEHLVVGQHAFAPSVPSDITPYLNFYYLSIAFYPLSCCTGSQLGCERLVEGLCIGFGDLNIN